MAKAKIGEGHAAAMARLGLAELRNAFTPSKESVADRDGGLYGMATQQEITDTRSAAAEAPAKESQSMRDLRALAKDAANGSSRDDDGPSRDRGLEI